MFSHSHQCRRRQMMWKMFTNSPSSLTFCPLQKTTSPNWTIYSWQGFNSIVCPFMLIKNYRCLQSLNICVDVAKFVENDHTLIQVHLLFVTKKDLSWLNNLFMAKFELIRMSSYAKTNYRCVQSLNISVDVFSDVEWLNTSVVYF